VRLLRERDDVLKRIKTLQDLRHDQRSHLFQINKLNNVKDSEQSVSAAERKTVNRREDDGPNAFSIKSALKNGNGFSDQYDSSQSEPPAKKAKAKDFDQGSNDFIPFSTSANGYSSSTSNTSHSKSRAPVLQGSGGGDGEWGGGRKADVNQNAKIVIVKRAKENAERRRFVDNPCSYFSQGTPHCSMQQCKHTIYSFLHLQLETASMEPAAL